MTCPTELYDKLSAGAYDRQLAALYGPQKSSAARKRSRARARQVVNGFLRLWPQLAGVPAALFSSPGRTELGGNHTDHQGGRVLCASVDMDMLACAAPNGTNTVELYAEGYGHFSVDLSDLSPRREELGTTAALVRGMAAGFVQGGHPVQGYCAYVTSNVPAGSGLSSSAALEVLLGVIQNHLFCNDILSNTRLAVLGQAAENRYFGKPCGLMDQMGCAVGGTIAIDLGDPELPRIRQIDFDYTASGYQLYIIDTGSDHRDLTDAYAAIPAEMGQVAAFFGQQVLSRVERDVFWQSIPILRAKVGDRAVLRAIHFFEENARVCQQTAALSAGDFEVFLKLCRQSGRSSAMYLQNSTVPVAPRHQAVMLAQAVVQTLLGDRGAVRVHGGGFAGTVQAFVPIDIEDTFTRTVQSVFGSHSCRLLHIRSQGGCVVV
ncbi:Galactokinase [Anaerotruncus sp. 2789STDY5834896]|uniref:Galactokinase n=1 Tax=uncultured Anaerotruncus sp. TaxID=905011 RepID=A0A1C6FSF7_9FIRM|nr:Galactokinase [uncultured Anaerotruncus sp.]